MFEAQKFNFNISMPGADGKIVPFKKMVTLESVIKWIYSLELDKETTVKLIEMVKKYPTSSLNSFKRNFNVMLARARQKIKEETQLDVVEECEIQQTLEIKEMEVELSSKSQEPVKNLRDLTSKKLENNT